MIWVLSVRVSSDVIFVINENQRGKSAQQTEGVKPFSGENRGKCFDVHKENKMPSNIREDSGWWEE